MLRMIGTYLVVLIGIGSFHRNYFCLAWNTSNRYNFTRAAGIFSETGDRAPLDFAFAALLYNSKRENVVCLGCIITSWWILDNCDDFYKYEYEYFKTGWTKDDSSDTTVVYKIKKRVRHISYNRMDFKIEEFDAKALYAAQNALILHQSEKEIHFIPEITRPVRVNSYQIIPKSGHGVYLNNNKLVKKLLRISESTRCDNFFQKYFDPAERIMLDNSLVCVDTKNKIKYTQCCNSQSVILSDNILIGIMAWSTGCSKEFGVDPWVLSNIGHYLPWIKENSDWENFNKNYFTDD